jgi:hypothetical protein
VSLFGKHNMGKNAGLLLAVIAFVFPVNGANFFVSFNGSDSGSGTQAADMAQPGDVITVRAGVYRERINPLRGDIEPGLRRGSENL